MPVDYNNLPADPWTCNDENTMKGGHGYGVNQGTVGPITSANPLASYDAFNGSGLAIDPSDEGLKTGWAKDHVPTQHN